MVKRMNKRRLTGTCGCNGTGQGTRMANLTAAERSSGERERFRWSTLAMSLKSMHLKIYRMVQRR
ncbi:hypothetical protein HanRHA438_Chr10g0446021 [Helianthus annuus]|nr:hypothetical protein HanRHA438_Chr10g0446021 [Helianthus annuus]